MNLVIIYGKVVSKVEFNFIYDRYNTGKELIDNVKYKHTSLARCEVELLNGSIVEIYGYDDMADYMYRNLKNGEFVLVEGKINREMSVECTNILYLTSSHITL